MPMRWSGTNRDPDRGPPSPLQPRGIAAALMPPTSTPLADRWPLRALYDVRDELLAAWDRPGYHDLRHLSEVLDRLDDLDRAGAVFDKVPVLLAAWFHDAVYDGQPDAEERSAMLAEATLPDPPAAEVARLVRMTEHHQAFPDDLNAAALSDADLAILAADPHRYEAYARDVRIEYAQVPDADFRAGRAAVLTDLMAGASLFRTPQGQALWEQRARANVGAEIEQLTAG
jgi:predicted metal-dependent HD superfamily phosphohydrolase